MTKGSEVYAKREFCERLTEVHVAKGSVGSRNLRLHVCARRSGRIPGPYETENLGSVLVWIRTYMKRWTAID